MPTMHLSARNIRTMERLYQHPVSHNLEWHDVLTLVEHLGTVKEETSGKLTLTVKDVSQNFHRSHGNTISDPQQVLALRHFFDSVGLGKKSVQDTSASAVRVVAVIAQGETKVFEVEPLSADPKRIHPKDTHNVLHHLQHAEGGTTTASNPVSRTYYEEICLSLTNADEILLMGSGTGASSAMHHLSAFLNTQHAQLAQKVVGSLTVDVESLTDGELLKQARAFFAPGVAA